MPKLPQHPVTVEVAGQTVAGFYTLERVGKWDRLTVWHRGRSAVEPEIAHEAEPTEVDFLAEKMLRQLVEESSD